MINWWYTDVGEAAGHEMLRAFKERRFTVGTSVSRVEELFCERLGVSYALLTNSGSSALLMALLSLELKHDDEVIVPALTWIATAQAAALLGCRVRVCDSIPAAPVIDTDQLKSIVNEKTRAIIPVHLNGRVCPLSDFPDLPIVEDTCKGMFSEGPDGMLGTIGEMGCFSLGMISPISIGYGGLIVTQSREGYEKLKKIRDHGVERNPEIYRHLGYNLKVSDLLASLAIPQLLDVEKRVSRLQEIHAKYRAGISSPYLEIMEAGSVPIYVEARSTCREEMIAYLEKHEIQVSRYHAPVSQAAYLGEQPHCPHAEALARECCILPSGTGQTDSDIERVIDVLNQFESKESYERDRHICYQ